MFSKFKLFIILSILVTLTIPSIAQQFILEVTIEKGISQIFDIDGDGICEYVADSNKVYDGATHLLKYTFPTGYLLNLSDHIQAENPYTYFPHIDYNSDGKRDLIIFSSHPNPEEVLVYDIINGVVLFQINPSGDNVWLEDLVDIDGDKELELVIRTRSGMWPNYIEKTYIYSTGVPITSVPKSDKVKPINFKLNQNYPNPFNPSTTIEYQISNSANVKIKIYDINGRIISNFLDEEKNIGTYKVIWNGKNDSGVLVSSGTYFYQVQVGDFVQAKKMILLR